MSRVISFNKLSFQNFLSFGNMPSEVNLNTGMSTLILGVNKDSGTEGYSKNGVGKSTIFQALFWVLFGEGIESIKQDDFINLKNKKRMSVTLEFVVDGIAYVLTRGRKPGILNLTKDGEPFTLHSANTVDESIRGLLGMTPEIFLNTYLLSKNDKNYMNLKPAAQREFMETLLTMDLLSKRASIIKAELKDVSTEIKVEEGRVQHIERTNGRTLENIGVLESKAKAWEDEIISGQGRHEATLKELQESVDVERELALIAELDGIRRELAEVEHETGKMQTKAERSLNTMETCQSEVHALEKGECPYCRQKYVNELLIDEKRDEIKKLQEGLDALEQELLPLLDKEEDLLKRLDTFKSEHPNLLSQEDCKEIMREIKRLKDKIDSAKDDVTNPYVEQIEIMKNSLEEVDTSALYELKKYETHCQLLVKLLTDSKGFIRKSIIDQYVPFLNGKINDYLNRLESPHVVMMNSDLTVDIEYMGQSISFGNLSNGEKLRVNLAVAMAFRDLVGVSSSLNVMLVDELLDSGLDEAGFNSAMKIFKSIGVSTFIISHREDLMTKVDQKLLVTKQAGFSTMVLQTA